LTDNDISNCIVGVYINEDSSSEINNCHIYNNYYGIRSEECCDLVISDTTVENNTHEGIYSGLLSSLEVTNCQIMNNGGEGIHAYDTPELVISDNIINNNGGDGIHFGSWNYLFIYHPVISNNHIENNANGIYANLVTCPMINKNIIKNNSDNGIYMNELIGYDENTNICYNIIYDNAGAGVYLDYYVDSCHILFYNNTISNNESGLTSISANSMEIFNNIFFQHQTGIFAGVELNCLEYNLFCENDTLISCQIPAGFGEQIYENINGDACDEYYNIFMDPLFVNPENDDYHLTFNSPAIDAGNPDPDYFDHDGTISDIGALCHDANDIEDSEIPEDYGKLLSNYPNPFNPETTIIFELESPGNIKINIYNVKGQLIRKLTEEYYTAGKHEIVWDGKDDKGNTVSSGIYFYRFTIKDRDEMRRILLIK
jgi:hypothetical protein